MDSGGGSASEASFARAVVAAVRAVPGVADVSPGRFSEAATYGPSEKVGGVVVGRAGGALNIDVHVCALYSASLALPELAAQVRSAVGNAAEGRGVGPIGRIDVAFDDMRIEEDLSG